MSTMALVKNIILFVIWICSDLKTNGQPLEVETGPVAMGDDLVAIVSELSKKFLKARMTLLNCHSVSKPGAAARGT